MSERVATVASQVSYAASGATVGLAALTAHDWAVIGGLAMAVATFVVNWIYKHKHYRLMKDFYERQD